MNGKNRQIGPVLISGVTLFCVIAVLCFMNGMCKKSDNGDSGPVFQPTVILISFDGFRWDYMNRTSTPNLDYLVTNGVKADALIPVFPTHTFPNHYTIVTGLYPENHGIVANTMYDPEFGEWFWIGSGSEPVKDGRWYEGEPLWVTAELQGQVTACYFWPGSEAAIKDTRPTYYLAFDSSVPNTSRVQQVLQWLDLGDNERPTFITLYFSDTDTWGHTYGPESDEMATAIKELDDRLGQLLDGLRARSLEELVNIIVVSDHGMTQMSRDRVIFLDDYINRDDVTIAHLTPTAMIWPDEGMEDTVYNGLAGAHPRMPAYKKAEIPERYHYRSHRRIPPIVCVAEEGWSSTWHETFDTNPDYYTGGTHGYDPDYSSMQGIFIACGPAFRTGVTVAAFQNIHIYELICRILNLSPAENDGNLDVVRSLLN